MKEIKTTIDKFEKVKIGEEDIIMYLSDDGREYRNKEDCEIADKKVFEHKNRQKIIDSLLLKMRYIKINGNDDGFLCDDIKLFFIENSDDLMEYSRLCHYSTKTYIEGNIGQWFYEEYNDGGDYPSSYYYYPVIDLINKLEEIKEKIKE